MFPGRSFSGKEFLFKLRNCFHKRQAVHKVLFDHFIKFRYGSEIHNLIPFHKQFIKGKKSLLLLFGQMNMQFLKILSKRSQIILSEITHFVSSISKHSISPPAAVFHDAPGKQEEQIYLPVKLRRFWMPVPQTPAETPSASALPQV